MKLITDEDFDNHILRGLLRRYPNLDYVRVQDVGLLGADDLLILEWANREERILLTHDRKTMPTHVTHRLLTGKSVAGVIIAP